MTALAKALAALPPSARAKAEARLRRMTPREDAVRAKVDMEAFFAFCHPASCCGCVLDDGETQHFVRRCFRRWLRLKEYP